MEIIYYFVKICLFLEICQDIDVLLMVNRNMVEIMLKIMLKILC